MFVRLVLVAYGNPHRIEWILHAGMQWKVSSAYLFFLNLAIVLFLPVTAVPRVYASTPFCFFVRNMLHIIYIRIVASVLISSYPGTF